MEQNFQKIKQKKQETRARNAAIASEYRDLLAKGIRYGLIIKKLADKYNVSEYTIYNAINVKQLRKEVAE